MKTGDVKLSLKATRVIYRRLVERMDFLFSQANCLPGLTVIKAGVVFVFVSFMVQHWSPGEQASRVIDILMRRRRTTNNFTEITIIHQDYGLGIVPECGQSGQNMD